MRKVFLTFADTRMQRALNRISDQARLMNSYDEILAENENSLDPSFIERFRDRLIPGSRGYGYWCWKPKIILQTLRRMNEGDILQYTDAGCHLNPDGQDRLQEYFQLVAESQTGILAFQAFPPSFHDRRIKLPDLAERNWCKGDLFDYFGVRDNPAVTDSQTCGATAMFIRKCPASVRFIETWLDVVSSRFDLLDDSPSRSTNLDGFVAHRHDQSIFSILCKRNNVATVSAYEYWYPDSVLPLPNWEILRNFPIHAKRDKGVHPLLKPAAFIMRVVRRLVLELEKSTARFGGSRQ